MTGRRRHRLALVLAFGVVAAACGDDDPEVAQNPPSADEAPEEEASEDVAPQDEATSTSEITVSADDIAFDTDRIEITAGEESTVTFDNVDDGIQHNFHVQAGDVDVKTDVAPGPDSQELSFTIDDAGDYTFICDVHPDQMTGDLVVS